MVLLFAIIAHNFFHFQLLVRSIDHNKKKTNLLFLPLGFLIEPNSKTSNGVALQRSNSLTSLTSTANADDLGVNTKDGVNSEEYLRICLSCQQILQRRYDQLCFKHADKDEIFVCYEKIVAARNELNHIQPIYVMMIESLL